MAAKARQACDLLKALAHEGRLMILCDPVRGRKIGDRARAHAGAAPADRLQQLARLRTDGLVRTRRNGKTVYYSLASEDVRIIIGAVREVFCRERCKG